MGIVVGFTVTATVIGHVHVEQVQLVVARHNLAVLVDQKRTGMRLGIRLIGRWQREGASNNP
ncbi:hypothetical protein D3C81_2015460 [compost metagenome]